MGLLARTSTLISDSPIVILPDLDAPRIWSLSLKMAGKALSLAPKLFSVHITCLSLVICSINAFICRRSCTQKLLLQTPQQTRNRSRRDRRRLHNTMSRRRAIGHSPPTNLPPVARSKISICACSNMSRSSRLDRSQHSPNPCLSIL